MPNWRQSTKKYKGRVVLRSDIVKDDSGSYAVFSEQRSSASQMTAAKVMDIIPRLPGCSGQAADAVSACTQVKMEDAPKLWKNPKSECPDIWIRLPRHKWPKSWSSMEEDPVVPLGRNLYGHPLARLLWEKQFEEILLKYGWEKVSNWESLFVHREKGYSYLCMWMTSNWLEKNKILIQSRISAGATEKLPCSENLRNSSWTYDMERHAEKCVERYCELANKTTQQLYKVSTPCIDDHHFKEEEMKSAGELSKVCSQIVLKCLYSARIGRPDILLSVNKLARSITKWTKACDKRLSRLISYIHHTKEKTVLLCG